MENLKVRVNSIEESKEAQELFFELGCVWQCGRNKYLDCGLDVFYILLRSSKEMSYCSVPEVEGNSKNTGYSYFKTITMAELHDMVVLKRNNVSDATHWHVTDRGNLPYLLLSDEWYFFSGSGWEKSTHKKDFFNRLEPIQNNDLPFIDSEESLSDKVVSTEVARQKEIDMMNGVNSIIKVHLDNLKSTEEARQKQPNQKTIDAMHEAESMIQKTLNGRQSSYGCFEDVAFLTQTMIDLLNTHTKFKDMPKPHKESLHMIFSKISRLTLGDHNHKDSWHDIQGYAKLVEDLIE